MSTTQIEERHRHKSTRIRKAMPSFLTTVLLVLGALSVSFTARATANYVNLYDALARLEVRTVVETYSLNQQNTSITLQIQIRNPTSYEGIRVESFYITPKYFQASGSTSQFPLGSSYFLFQNDLRDTLLTSNGEIRVQQRMVIVGDTGFQQFYNNQTTQPSLVYESFLRLWTALESYCNMGLYLTPQGARIACGTSSLRISNYGL